MILTTNDKTLIFDESGNLGKDGRYFVISCIETKNPKSLHNIGKKKLLQAKNKFPEMKFKGCELKAFDAFPAVKYHILESICSKDICISYIVIDLKHVDKHSLKDNNLLYNYACKILIKDIVLAGEKEPVLNIWFDNHTTKVHSKNSFSDYIKLELIYSNCLNMNINVEYINSNATNAYVIQAADFVANAIYSKYEYENELFYNVIKSNLHISEHFPKCKFSK